MSSHPESGLPAPESAPLSPGEAARLLDSIRQTEAELAESGEAAAVAPSESRSQPPVDVLLAVAAALAPDADSTTERTAGSETSAAGPDATAVHSDEAGESATAASDSESTVIGDLESAAVIEAEEIVAAVEIEPVTAPEPVSAEVEFVPVEEAAVAADVADAATESVNGSGDAVTATDSVDVPSEDVAPEALPVSPAAPSTSGLILPGSVADDVETIVHVMRHGEVHNPKGILYGRLPGFQLSTTGRAQAQTVARTLAGHDIALVVASPLQRAQETAEPIAAHHGLTIRTDDNLIEAGNTFEGLRVSIGDGALRKPRHWWKMRDPFTPSWGEPYLQIAHRMLAAANKARVEAAGREAVLVSHQLPVWTLRRFLQGQRLWHDPRNRQCSLASLTSLVYQGDTLIDIVYSEPAGASDPKATGA